MTEDFTVLDKKFSKGDVLVMISDGLPEAPNKKGDLLDYEAVKNCVEENSLKSAEEIKDELVKLSDNWLQGIHNPDDITIVVCKKTGKIIQCLYDQTTIGLDFPFTSIEGIFF